MVVLVTYKNEDPINNEGARVFTTLHIGFSDAQGSLLWNSAKIQTHSSFMHVLVNTCKNDEDPIKMKALEYS